MGKNHHKRNSQVKMSTLIDFVRPPRSFERLWAPFDRGSLGFGRSWFGFRG
jgi:hypothetical protein